MRRRRNEERVNVLAIFDTITLKISAAYSGMVWGFTMRARVLDRKEAMVLECAGRLTIQDRKSVERISNNITRSGYSQVVIDLSKLDYIDSGGLGILLLLRDGAVDRGKRIAISGAADSVREVLDIASFGTLFEIR